MKSIRNALAQSAKIIADERKRVWLKAWNSVAASDNCIRISTCDEYADACLKSYDERFLT